MSLAAEVCPPAGAALPAAAWPLAAGGLLLAGSAAIALARRRLDRFVRQRGLRALVVLAMLLVAAATTLDLVGHTTGDLAPRAEAWSASVAALLAWQGLHAPLMLLCGGLLVARSWCGHLQPEARARLDNVALLWHYTTVQGLLAMGMVYGLPGWIQAATG